MFQRIQSLYLIISLALISILHFLPMGEIILENTEIYKFSILNISSVLTGEQIASTLPVTILVVMLQLLVFVTLLLYKKRPVQVRLCVFSLILTIGLYGLISYYFIKLMNNFEVKIHVSYSLIFPLIALFFIYFAIRAIKKDENLIRSVDRIR